MLKFYNQVKAGKLRHQIHVVHVTCFIKLNNSSKSHSLLKHISQFVYTFSSFLHLHIYVKSTHSTEILSYYDLDSFTKHTFQLAQIYIHTAISFRKIRKPNNEMPEMKIFVKIVILFNRKISNSNKNIFTKYHRIALISYSIVE